MFISEPKKHTGKNPLVYFSVTTWKDKKSLGNERFCTLASEAITEAEKAVKTGVSVMATVREEIVYKRTSACELSTSTPIFNI